MRSSVVPAGELVPTADQRVVIHGVSWSHFEAQLALKGESSIPRIAYLSGALELMSPSKDHERIKSLIGRLVEVYALDAGYSFTPYGGWTLKKQVQEAGAEPDECYIVGPDQAAAVPNLVIEVVWTSGGLDKLEIYRRLGVGEFWQWRDGRIEVFILRRGRYVRSARSRLFPDLDLEFLLTFLDRPSASDAMRAFRAALTRRRSATPVRRRRR